MRAIDYMTASEYVKRICQTARLLPDEEFEKTILGESGSTSTLVICHTARDAENLRKDLMCKCGCTSVRWSDMTVTTLKGHVIRFAWITNCDMLRGMSPTFVYVY